jgi:protein involved in polysaccharide export with SLBB domain
MISNPTPGGSARPPGAHVRRSRVAAGGVLGLLVALMLLGIGPGAVRSSDDSDMRDFPPEQNPNREPATPAAPETLAPATPPGLVPVPAPPDTAEEVPEAFTLGVGDDVQVSVLGQPEFSRSVKVLPTGSITTPVAGDIYVLGRTPGDIGHEIEQKLDRYLRHPRVDVIIASAQERMVYVMGEVLTPGERVYRPGLTALQTVAQAGGLTAMGKASSVLVMRRTGKDDAVMFRLNFSEALKGRGKGDEDMNLRPYDIVFVPRTFIGTVDIFIEQYLRPMLVPFDLYLTGWDAIHVSNQNLRLSGHNG